MTVKSKSSTSLPPSSEASAAAVSTRSDKSTKEETKDEETGSEHVSQDGSSDDDSTSDIKLYKSTRLKGYITLLLASAINYSSATQSDSAILNTAVPATQGQKNYAMAVSMTT